MVKITSEKSLNFPSPPPPPSSPGSLSLSLCVFTAFWSKTEREAEEMESLKADVIDRIAIVYADFSRLLWKRMRKAYFR